MKRIKKLYNIKVLKLKKEIKMKRGMLSVLVCCIVAVVLVGCGNADKPASTPTSGVATQDVVTPVVPVVPDTNVKAVEIPKVIEVAKPAEPVVVPAKTEENAKPAETPKVIETVKPVTAEPVTAPVAAPAPAAVPATEIIKPAEPAKPAEPTEPAKPVEAAKPTEAPAPTEPAKAN